MTVLLLFDKHDLHVIDATDKDAALLEMVRIIDDNEYYDVDDMPAPQVTLLNEARAGNAVSARKLAENRHGYEYERWRFETCIIPGK